MFLLYLDSPSGWGLTAVKDFEALSHGTVLVFKVVYDSLQREDRR